VIEIYEGVRGPDLCRSSSRVTISPDPFHKDAQDLQRLFLQLEFPALRTQFSRCIQLKAAETNWFSIDRQRS
jgi:hypothetical protein